MISMLCRVPQSMINSANLRCLRIISGQDVGERAIQPSELVTGLPHVDAKLFLKDCLDTSGIMCNTLSMQR